MLGVFTNINNELNQCLPKARFCDDQTKAGMVLGAEPTSLNNSINAHLWHKAFSQTSRATCAAYHMLATGNIRRHGWSDDLCKVQAALNYRDSNVSNNSNN